MRTMVSKERFIKDFKAGASIFINLTGTTFECKLAKDFKRADIISVISSMGDFDSVDLSRTNEPENTYDKNGAASRIDATFDWPTKKRFDLGYIPVRGTVSYVDNIGNHCTYVSSQFNFDIYDCDYLVELSRLGVSGIGPWVTVCLTHR